MVNMALNLRIRSWILRRRRWTWAQKLCHKPPQRRGAHGVCGVPSDKVFQIFTKGNEFRISIQRGTAVQPSH